MSANFPNALPAFTDPIPTTKMNVLSHAVTQHSLENDEITAIATKLGVGATTPTLSAILVGTGTGITAWTITPTLATLTVTGTLTAGTLAVTTMTLSGDPGLTLTAAASRIVPGATSLSLRNNANNLDNLIILDAGAATFRTSLMVSTTLSVGVTGAGSFGTRLNGAATAAAGNAYALAVQPTITAFANGDTLNGLFLSPTFTAAGKTGLTLRLLNIVADSTAPDNTSTKVALTIGAMTGANANNIALDIAAPSGAATLNIGLRNAGTSTLTGLVTAAGGITMSAGNLTNSVGRIVLGGDSTNYSIQMNNRSGDGAVYIGTTHSATPDILFYNNGAAEIARFTNAGALSLLGKATTYNNIATAGWGVPAIQAAGRSAGASGGGTISTYTVGAADGSFVVSANVNVVTATTHNFTVTCTYTDEGNTSRVLTMGFTQLTGATFLTAITNVTGAGPYESPVYHIRCKASTTITVATTGTFTAVTYNAEGIIQQVA